MNLCDSKFFEKIYSEYSDRLYRFLYYKYQDREMAEDITQNVFLKIWENCKKFHLTNFKSLLFTMGNNEFLNRIKKSNTQKKYILDNDQIVFESPEFIMETQEFDRKLQLVLDRLKPEERQTFLMNRIDKMKYREIAETLEISVKTVEKRIHNVLLFIRSEIKEFNH